MSTTETTPEAAARLTRISGLTLEQARRALHYLAGYTPEGFDEALDGALRDKWEPVLCATCGDSGTELDEVVSISLADGSTRRWWYCHDIVACQDRRHPELAALARDAEAAQAVAP